MTPANVKFWDSQFGSVFSYVDHKIIKMLTQGSKKKGSSILPLGCLWWARNYRMHQNITLLLNTYGVASIQRWREYVRDDYHYISRPRTLRWSRSKESIVLLMAVWYISKKLSFIW